MYITLFFPSISSVLNHPALPISPSNTSITSTHNINPSIQSIKSIHQIHHKGHGSTKFMEMETSLNLEDRDDDGNQECISGPLICSDPKCAICIWFIKGQPGDSNALCRDLMLDWDGDISGELSKYLMKVEEATENDREKEETGEEDKEDKGEDGETGETGPCPLPESGRQAKPGQTSPSIRDTASAEATKFKKPWMPKLSPLIVCPFCPQQFKRKVYLQLHLLEQHPEQGRRPFRCTYGGGGCEAHFTLEQELEVHREQHERGEGSGNKGTLCHYCGKLLKRARYFETHVRVHVEGRKLSGVQCSHCGVTCKDVSYLQKHRTTTQCRNKIAYRCKICPNKAFSRPHLLKKHALTHC